MEKEVAEKLYREVMKYSQDEKVIKLYKEFERKEHTKDLLHQGMGMHNIMKETGLTKEEIKEIVIEMKNESDAYLNDEWF